MKLLGYRVRLPVERGFFWYPIKAQWPAARTPVDAETFGSTSEAQDRLAELNDIWQRDAKIVPVYRLGAS